MAWNLTHEVVLREPTTEAGRAGGKGRTTYTDIVTRAALLRSLGSERITGGGQGAGHMRSFVIRYNPDINTKWQVAFGGLYHGIESIEPIPGSGRNRFVKLDCVATNNTVSEIRAVDTGPQPLFGITSQNMIGVGARQNIDVSSAGFEIENQPMSGELTEAMVQIADPTPGGKYIVFLFPQAWGNPTGFYYRGDTVFNQIGAFRFVPANLIGSTSEFSHRYTAMVSSNRKLTDDQVTGTIVWDRRST